MPAALPVAPSILAVSPVQCTVTQWLVMVADSTITIAASGTASASAASTPTTTMTTTLTTTRTAMTIHTTTTAAATWFSGTCTPSTAGAINPFRCAAERSSFRDLIANGRPTDDDLGAFWR